MKPIFLSLWLVLTGLALGQDEPTPAGSLFDQTIEAAKQTSSYLLKVREDAGKTKETLSATLSGKGAPKPTEETEKGFKPKAKPIPKEPVAEDRAEKAAKTRSVLEGAFSKQLLPEYPLELAEAPRASSSGYAASGSGIDVPATSPLYEIVEARSQFEGKGYGWWVDGPDGRRIKHRRLDGGKSILFGGPPGRYSLMHVCTREGGELDQGEADTVIGDAPPDPGPSPVPTPTPNPTPTPVPNPTPTPTVAPTAEFQAYVAAVRAIAPKITPADKAALASFYTEFANVVLSNPQGVVKTTRELSEAHVMAAGIMFEGRLKNKYEGLSTGVNKAIADTLGTPSGAAMDGATRQRAVDIFKALAWAVSQ